MEKTRNVVVCLLLLSLGLILVPSKGAGQSGGCSLPECVGRFSLPFAEPTIMGQPTANKCIEDAQGTLHCKPAAGSLAVLRNGRILYYNALEGTENVELSVVAEFGRVSVNDQSRVLSLGSNDSPSWSKPTLVDGGAVNEDDETLTGGGLDTNDSSNSNNGALFCSDLVQLADGRIIAVGGTDYYLEPGIDSFPFGVTELEGIKNARIFNPWRNTWTQTGSMKFGRWYPSLVSLPDSNLFVASGVTKLLKPIYPDQPFNSGRNVVQTETYSLDCGTWSENGPLAERSLPLFPRLHLLPNGHVFYNAAGQAFNPAGQAFDQALWNIQGAYNPQTRTWTDLAYAGFPLQLNQVGLQTLTTGLNITNPLQLLLLTQALLGRTVSNPAALAGELSRLLGLAVEPGALETAIGSGFRGSTFSIMLPLKPDANGNYTKAEFLTAGGVLGAAVLTSPGAFLGVKLSRIDSVTTAASGMSTSSRLTGPLSHARWYSSGVLLPDGSVMAFSGANRDEVVFPGGGVPIKQAERFDPATETWKPMAVANNPRTYHNTAALLPDGRVIIGGHAPINTAYLFSITLPGFSPNDGRDPSFEIYSPPYVFRSDRPTITAAPNSVSHGQTFTIHTPQAGSISNVTLIRYTAMTHLVDGDQRAVQLRVLSRTTNSLTVQMPQTAAVAPAGPYMLFINRGTSTGLVPSVSKRVMVQRPSGIPCSGTN